MFSLETAVDEAVSNIIEHAYEGEGKGDIVCTVLPLSDSVKIILEDHGQSFDPSCVPIPDVTAELDDRMDHGLGVYMMCQLLDDIHFEFLDGTNRLTLLKNKTPEPLSLSLLEPLQLWKHFLHLGEELLKQPNALVLCKKFGQTVERELACKAKIWLSRPYYPLPGEPEVETLPNNNAPQIVQRACSENKMLVGSSDCELALPIITQSYTLGVLHVDRPVDHPFSEQEKQLLEALVATVAVSMQVNRQVVLKNWRFDQISLVRSVSSQIANVLDLDELCKRVTNLIQCSFHYYHVSLYTIEEGSTTLKFRASSLNCSPSTEPSLYNIKIGEGLIGTVALTGKEIIANDVTKEPRFKELIDLPDTKSEAVLPLLVENRILGVLDVQSDAFGAFHEMDLLVVRTLADNIALATEGARIYEKLQERAKQMSAVAEINYALSSILDLEKLLKEIVNVIHARFSIPLVHIYTVHPGRQKVIFQAGSGKRAQNLKMNSFAFDLDSPIGMIPHVARTGKSMLANDVAKESLFRPSRNAPNETKAEMTIPLKFGDNVLGVLDLQSNETNVFDDSQLDLFEGLASGIALSIRNATLFRTEIWRRSVAETFKDVAGMLSSNLALDELLERILTQLESTLPCDAAAIWLLDHHGDDQSRNIRLAAVRGTSRKKVVAAREDSSDVSQFLELPIDQKIPIIRKPSDPYGPLGAAGGFPPDYSSIAVPLLSGEDVIGVLTLAHHATGRYGSEASLISSTFASYAAVAIENASLYANAQADAWSSTVLLQVAEAMQSITNVDELLSTMVRLTPLLVGINQCAIFLRDATDSSCHLEAWYGFTPAEEEKLLRDDQSLSLLKMRLTQEPVFISDPASDLGISSLTHDTELGTLVLIPLLSHGEILGGFLVSHNSSGEFGIRNVFNDQTLAILQGIARQTSIALENIRLVESRQEEAYITAVLLQVAQAVVSQNKLEDILDTIVHLMPILVGVNTCVIYLFDEKSHSFLPANAIAPTHDETEELQTQSYQLGDLSLLDDLMNADGLLSCPLDNPDILPSEWKSLQWQRTQDTDLSTNRNWLIGMPLSIKGVVFGALIAKETNILPEFHPKRLELIRGVAQQTTLAIQNERLKQEMVGRERMEREFQLARQIQKAFLPESLPEHKEWQISRLWQTAREVGGDFYDIFETKDKRIALVIADVADKGMPAALYMTVTRTLIRATLQSSNSPGKVLARVNDLLESESRNGMFVTAFLALLDPKTGVLEYANAGHNLPLLIHTKTASISNLEKDGIALGVLPQAEYKDKKITLEFGETLLFYTDGVTEAFSAEGELFSEPRLINALQNSTASSADELLASIEKLIQDFRNGEPPSDDLTMIALRRNGQ
ncbi:GAF domain-containing protein [bacterium]|nr:GAF domain-containing protein [bacterium]